MANYVEKAELHDELVKYLKQRDEALAQGKKPKKPSDKIGLAILKIAEGLAQKHNFRNYTWLDEMIGDGIVAATNAIDKYDPQRMTQSGTPNPYGYFTQCIYWAFQNRISDEKAESEKRNAMMRDVLQDFYINGGEEDIAISREYVLSVISNE